MKRFIYTMLPVLFSMTALGQKEYYIFIQENSGQLFYARMGEKSFSSTAGGHILLANLHDSTFNLYLGFPKNAIPEQLFVVPLGSKDRGFELKNMNGIWELFDLQSLQFIKGAPVKEKTVAQSGEKKTDTYSQLMANVVNDSAVQYSSVAKTEEAKAPVKNDPPAPVVVKKEKVNGKKNAVPKKVDPPVQDTSVLVAARDTVSANQVAVAKLPAKIVRYGSENTEEGKEIIYLDRTGPVVDTIRIIIPRL